MSNTIEVRVPDIGDFKEVPVIEVLVKAGDRVKKNDSLVTLESEKASMEVPADTGGIVDDVRVRVGDRVSEGSTILVLRTDEPAPEGRPAATSAAVSPSAAPSQTMQAAAAPQPTPLPSPQPPPDRPAQPSGDGFIHAGPAIRKFARELGVDLRDLRGSGPNGRVTRDDVQGFVRESLQRGSAPSPIAELPPWPKIEFAQYGEIERRPLSRIKRLSGPNLHRNWLQIPHITNYDEADVTELEAFRNEINSEQSARGGPKLTMLAFLVKASVAALKRYPEFNASLDRDELILKRYYNIGFAADTPDGLIVPVIKNAAAMGLLDIAKSSAELAAKARDGKLSLGDMQGGTFTISSIGGIGGTAFTQIINAPEVAILGATRGATKPIWNGDRFEPRLILPVSVSYDHRVIDGAAAARFLTYLSALLSDFRRVIL